jgi:general nucleoside transport system ATP-binding protein
MAPEIELRNITKRFPGVLANDRISLAVAKGEVRALVGENGAGKSTLMRLLYGLYQPDAGEIVLRGQRVAFRSPQDAIRAGLGMIHQHFMLFPSLSVYENIVYGAEPTRWGFVERYAAEGRVAELARAYGLNVGLDTPVGELPVGMRQRVEILKLLYRRAEILILDEPTAVLAPQEKEELFGVIRRLADNGKTIIFITHKLDEVMRVCDRATVLRGGAVITTLETARTSPAELSRAMVGRSVVLRAERGHGVPGAAVLEVAGLRVAGAHGTLAVRDVSLAVRAGEIVGVAGVAGNGQNELIEAIVGLRPLAGGSIKLGGRELAGLPVAARRAAGLAYIPEDRSRVGLALDAPLDENLLMGYQRREPFARRGLLQWNAVMQHARELVARYAIKAVGTRQTAATLSGGNRQKGVVARELGHEAALLIAEQPTWGVDVGSIEFIHQQLLAERVAGRAVLLVSSELSEVMALSDRILVLFEGTVAGEVAGQAATEKGLGMLMLGAASDTPVRVAE